MKKVVKKIVRKKVSPIPESVKGLKLAHFKLQDRSEFQVGRRIWFQFHYDNLSGADVSYGSMGMAIHKWDGSTWQLHAYKHSFGGPKGRLRAGGGPGGGPFHDDNWKADEPGEFALMPYVSFDSAAAHKIETLKDPAAVEDVWRMAMPLYATIRRDKPGALHDNPPAPFFPEKWEEVEVEEVVDVEEGEGGQPGQPGDGGDTEAPVKTSPPGVGAGREVTRQVIEWRSGSGVGAVRIELSRRDGDHWSVHTVLNQALDADNRIEVIFLEGD
jgi:hypothetical protein